MISLTVRTNGGNKEELPYCKMLNRLLPKSIRIIAWSPVTEGFSARFNCEFRTYKYWFPRGDLDIDVCTIVFFFFCNIKLINSFHILFIGNESSCTAHNRNP